MPNGKVMIIHLIVGLIKKKLFYKNESFSTFHHSKNKIEVKLDLSNYAKKSYWKNATGFDTSQFPKKMI